MTTTEKMLGRREIQNTLLAYSKDSIAIGVLGSHSAEETAVSAKSFGFPTVLVAQKGREELYAKYNKNLFDHVIVFDAFAEVLVPENLLKLRQLNTLLFPNRALTAYLKYDSVEQDLTLPLYGSRGLLRCEERTGGLSQYKILKEAGITVPKKFASPEDIDNLVIVKVQQKDRPLERAFFFADSKRDFYDKSQKLMDRGIIDHTELRKAHIEQYVMGQKFNANFHSWALKDTFDNFDFVGFDDRRQSNLHGVLSLPATDQLSLDIEITNEEVGHTGITMRESLKQLVYEAAEKFSDACKRLSPPGIIGPFALQGAIAYSEEKKGLDFYVFDVSPRTPGSPVVGPTSPEIRRLNLKYAEFLRRIDGAQDRIESQLDLSMLEIRYAIAENRLHEIVT